MSLNYIGIKACGCALSAIVIKHSTPAEVADWLECMKQQGIKVELHGDDWIKKNFGHCKEHSKPIQKSLL